MIVALLSGGLGNQMFQYASAIALSKHLNCDCKFDLGWFEASTIHNGLEIDKIFDIDLPQSTVSDVKNVLGYKYPFFKLIRSKILSPKISLFTDKIVFTEKTLSRKSIGIGNLKDLYMSGYWQSEDYFLGYGDLIRSAFKFSDPSGVDVLRDRIASSEISVSIHIRRGDYISNKKSNELLGTCSEGYYRAAIANIESLVNVPPTYFIFSDDTVWAKETFSDLKNAIFVSGNVASKSYLDMYLMTLCDYHIIANSTFSWWGAWLAVGNRDTVYAPVPWFDKNSTELDVIPSEWKKIDKNISL